MRVLALQMHWLAVKQVLGLAIPQLLLLRVDEVIE